MTPFKETDAFKSLSTPLKEPEAPAAPSTPVKKGFFGLFTKGNPTPTVSPEVLKKFEAERALQKRALELAPRVYGFEVTVDEKDPNKWTAKSEVRTPTSAVKEKVTVERSLHKGLNQPRYAITVDQQKIIDDHAKQDGPVWELLVKAHLAQQSSSN